MATEMLLSKELQVDIWQMEVLDEKGKIVASMNFGIDSEMRQMSGKQKHVLANLERVISLPRKITTTSISPRFQLDGWECTYQITCLQVRGRVKRSPDGQLTRVECAD